MLRMGSATRNSTVQNATSGPSAYSAPSSPYSAVRPEKPRNAAALHQSPASANPFCAADSPAPAV